MRNRMSQIDDARGGFFPFSMVWVGALCALALAVSCSSPTEQTAQRGSECDEEGRQDGTLVCEDGTWVEEGADAGNDATGDDCEPESHDEFCERHDVECGSFVGEDNCGQERSVHCGEFEGFECGDTEVCVHADDDDELETNRCECPELSDQPADEIWEYAGAGWGTVQAAEVCEGWEGLGEVDCGDCQGVDGQCGEEVDNVCGCPCEIDGTCYATGESSPDDACMICDPEESQEEFTEADDGTECDDNAVCQGGDCVCEEGAEECGGECVDLESSRDHCGECDNDCNDDQVCSTGDCVDQCPDDDAVCDGECVDLQTSLDHCGECNDACDAGDADATAECTDGDCVIECNTEGETYCGSECTDLQTDPDNCDECGDQCTTDVDGAYADCEEGECVEYCENADEEICDDQCTNTQTDPDNCGECGEPCGEFENCVEGVCEGIGGGSCENNGDCGPSQECCDSECIPPTETCN